MSRTKLILLLLVPLLLFALGLLYVDARFEEGDVLRAIGSLVLLLALLATVEGVILRRFVIPFWGESGGTHLRRQLCAG